MDRPPATPVQSDSLPTHNPLPVARESATPSVLRQRGIRIGSASGVLLLIGGAAAAIEWAGWQVAWRYGATLHHTDALWRSKYLLGVARNAAGAAGVGVACAALAWAVRRVISRRTDSTWRVPFRVFAVGAAMFLAALAVLTSTAP